MSLNYFFKHEERVQKALDVLRYLDAKGSNGVTYSTMRRDLTDRRREFIRDVMIPHGYARKQIRFRKQERVKGCRHSYYQRIVKYYITPEGEDLILDLENKYKEHKMKALYGRIL